jgi:NAD(P)-dependent dehydrogenase (short-subunit alcohol dehydrogenase family)
VSRLVLITGAAGGIGRRLVFRFASLGDTVFAQDLAAERLDQVIEECANLPGMVTRIVADITDARALFDASAAVVPADQSVDVLIANAGGALTPTLAQTTFESWYRDIALNLNGAMHSVEAVRGGMIAKGKGAIVIIGSVNALLGLGHPAYSAAKAGLISYIKSLAIEFGRFGVRSNIILPGTVRTPAWQERVDKNPAVFDQLVKWYPLGRVVDPDDIADAAIFLASDSAKAITGAVLPVDCGLLAGNRLMASELTLEQF